MFRDNFCHQYQTRGVTGLNGQISRVSSTSSYFCVQRDAGVLGRRQQYFAQITSKDDLLSIIKIAPFQGGGDNFDPNRQQQPLLSKSSQTWCSRGRKNLCSLAILKLRRLRGGKNSLFAEIIKIAVILVAERRTLLIIPYSWRHWAANHLFWAFLKNTSRLSPESW